MAAPSTDVQVETGDEILDIDTEGLGFFGLQGDKKLKLLPTPWPENNLPPPTSSLFSIASKTGILAAAGPDALVIATTESVRQTISGKGPEENGAKIFSPQVTIQVPRLSQVAFSSNETYLVVSAEDRGGLVVYEVSKLQLPNPRPVFEIPTNGTSVRALVPNPWPEFEDSFSVVLSDGKLLLAQLDSRKLDTGPSGSTVLHENVSSVSWSVKGRQLVAGLGDGTAVQLKPEGDIVAQIPRPPEIGPDQHIASIYWLGNNEFLVTHYPTKKPEEIPVPTHHIIQRDKNDQKHFTFSKISLEPCYPALEGRRGYPAHYFAARLRNWEPSLMDLLILVSTDSVDVGTLTSSSVPLAPDAAIKTYTVTRLEDSRQAMVPRELLTEDGKSGMGADASIIGIVLDLSATESVLRPIPKEEEIDKSPTPLPAFMMLTHEGILCAWWVVYNESIKEKTGFPGLVALGGAIPATPLPSAPSVQVQETPKPLPANSLFGTAAGNGGFTKAATPSFGSPGLANASSGSRFSQPGFGSSTPLGAAATAPGFGKPAFGAAATPLFGAAGGIGNRPSPWASTTATPNKIASPQSQGFASFSGAGSSFAKIGSNVPSQPAFGGATNSTAPSGFAALGQQKSGSLFGQTLEPTSFTGTSTDSFGSTVTIGSSYGGATTPSSWAQTPAQPSSLFGGAQSNSFASTSKDSDMGDSDDAQNRERDEATPTPQAPPAEQPKLFGVSNFKLDSSFKGDGTAKDDLPKPPQPSNQSLFGGGFLSGVDSKPKEPTTPIREDLSPPRLENTSTTPAAPPKFQSVNQTPSLFGSLQSTTPSHTPAKALPKEAQKSAAPSPPESPVGEDAPLPPDPTTFKPKDTTDDDLPPIAGSPAIEVEAPDSSPISSPRASSSEDGGDISVEEQEDTEGEHQPQAQRPSWSFGPSLGPGQIPPQAPTPPVKSGTSSRSRNQSRSPSRSPVRGLFQQSSTPAGNPFANQKAPIFQAPSRPQDSLRSPSPVRSASTSAVGRRQKPPPTASPFNSSAFSPPPQPPAPAPEVSDLSDDENDRIRQELQSEVRPNRRLDPFVAHQNYTGGSGNKSGVPAQIETVYRDINSMIDTLGINARSLASFVKYHAESARNRAIERGDLDEALDQGEEGDWDEEWCLAELDELIVLEDELGHELDSGRLTQVHDKLLQLAGLSQDVHRLRTRVADLRVQIQARNDPIILERLRLQPLSAEVMKMQRELRDSFAAVLKRLALAEEDVVLLRTKIAGAGKGGRTRTQVPTVEAVTKTIEKMTAMVTKKSGDIDVLENSLKKLNLKERSGTPGAGASIRGRGMREASPFATPPRSSRALVVGGSKGGAGRTYGLFDTPDGTPNGKGREPEDDQEAVRVFNEKRATRKKLGQLLAKAVLEKGTKVTGIGT